MFHINTEPLGRLHRTAQNAALVARAQQPSMPVVGFLRSTSAANSTHLVLHSGGVVRGGARWAPRTRGQVITAIKAKRVECFAKFCARRQPWRQAAFLGEAGPRAAQPGRIPGAAELGSPSARMSTPRRAGGAGYTFAPCYGLNAGSLPAAQARRLVERFEWHYTPKHGSWLDMAEAELGVLASQCLDSPHFCVDWGELTNVISALTGRSRADI